jgi:SAM-dependent methyltransferase
MDMDTEVRHYDDVYTRYNDVSRCRVSIDNLDKARRRVRQTLRSFGISIKGKRVLDIGSGLGYVAEALRLEGAYVTAIDASEVAIRRAAKLFPAVEWRCALFPQQFMSDDKFDLVWILDISTLNTFDIDEMRRDILDDALLLVNPGGALIVGWHSDFSGIIKGDWSHWSMRTIRRLRRELQFAGPRVVQARFAFLSWLVILACRIAGKSCPIFFSRSLLLLVGANIVA